MGDEAIDQNLETQMLLDEWAKLNFLQSMQVKTLLLYEWQ